MDNESQHGAVIKSIPHADSQTLIKGDFGCVIKDRDKEVFGP